MKFVVEIELGNDAMQNGQDVRRALIQVANRANMLDDVMTMKPMHIIDENGNTVGTAYLRLQ